jgi:hypothetical protein
VKTAQKQFSENRRLPGGESTIDGLAPLVWPEPMA